MARTGASGWAPPLFGVVLRTPGVVVVCETCERLTVTIAPEALRPVAELFGFRKPARTVEFLESAVRAREGRARRVTAEPRFEASGGPAGFQTRA